MRVAVSLAVRGVAHDRPMTSTAFRVRFADRLDREWAHLSHRREVVAHARAWGLTTRPFASLDELVVLTGLTGPRATAAAGAGATVIADDEADELLHRLAFHHAVRLVGRADRAAAHPRRPAANRRRRAATATPTSTRRACWWARPGSPSPATADREPARWPPACSTTPDTARSSVRAAGAASPRCSPRRPASPSHSVIPADSPCDELAAVLRAAGECGLAAAELALVRGVLVHGTRAVAGRLAVTPRTVRNRRGSRRRHHPRPRRLTDGRFPSTVKRKPASATRRRQSKSAGRLSRKAAMPSWASGVSAAAAITSTA